MKRDYPVYKSNKLVSSRYDLSVQEQRVILTLVSMINPQEDKEFFNYKLKISDFCELIGVENTNHTYIARITKQLMEKVVEIEDNNCLTQVHWISTCEYHKQQGTVEIELHKKLAPYLLQLRDKFTKYYLSNVLQMKSKYSIRLYEICKSNEFKNGNFTIEIEELKKIMKCESYKLYGHFKSRVIEQAIKEINTQTDIFVSYEEQKQGRKVVALEFTIKNSFKENMELYAEDTVALDWKQDRDLHGEIYEQRVLL